MSVLYALRSGFGFLTTIPVGISLDGIKELMRHTYLFPVVGAVIGILLGAAGWLLEPLPAMISAVLIIAFMYLITGINHLDGLSDFGDGVTAHGTIEKKVDAMKDVALGAGGAAFCIIMLLALYSALASMRPGTLPLALVAAEVGAKQSMVTVAAFGTKIHEGFGSMSIDSTEPVDFLIGLFFSAAVCVLALGYSGVISLIASVLSAFLVLNVAKRNFGGVSGDVIGASNEIGRAVSLLAIAAGV